VRMRFAAPIVLAALAALTAGCTPSDQPADVTSSTAPPPRAAATSTATTTSGAGATGTSAPEGGQVISVTVAGGQVTPAPAPVDVALGSTVVIEVTSDVPDSVHVHGYDQQADLVPGRPTRLELTADIPGQFEVELESAHELLLMLRVR